MFYSQLTNITHCSPSKTLENNEAKTPWNHFTLTLLVTWPKRLQQHKKKCVYLSANRFPTMWENGIWTSNFVSRLPMPSENGIWDSIFIFRFPTTLQMEFQLLFSFFCFPTTLDNRILIVTSFFRLSFYKILKNGIWTSIFISVSVFLSPSYVTRIRRILALPVANYRPGNHILDEVFVCCFLTEENYSYEDLLEVIKNCYLNLRGCTVVC